MISKPLQFLIFFNVLLFLCVQSAMAQENITPTEEKFFETKIRPVLIGHCYECHSIDSGMTRGGLLVDSRDGLLQGGESGPAIDVDRYQSTPFWTAITYQDHEMPPAGQLPDNVIADFKKWFEMGAPDPRVRKEIEVKTLIDVDARKSHWAFQKPNGDPESSIDALVDQKRLSTGTQPVEQAEPMTLLRRIYFDLIGLPPSVEEINAFKIAWTSDPNRAWQQTVDELLARPQYGERWGRHWLDVARYAESSGNGNFTYPHAWRYRDFVIDAFNQDTPYDKFIQQQIAGDLMPARTDSQWQENLIATGFLAVGIKDQGERNPRVFEMELIDEQIDTTTQAFLGLTVSCARCHDHKFDPIPTVDYYAIAGIFKSTQTLYGTTFGQQNHQSTKLLELPIADKVSASQSFSKKELDGIQDKINSIQNEIRSIRRAANSAGGEKPDQRTMVAKRNQIGRLQGLLKTVDDRGKPYTYAMGVQDREVVDAHVLLGGDVEQKAQVVSRGFLQVLSDIPSEKIKSESSGRRELAKWIGNKENPLTARVMVNRIWMHLLGAPIMESPNNWGLSSMPPSNPELLDNLAVKFMANGWSIKTLIREIVLSATYRRASTFHQDNYHVDPDNRSFWRTNARQLDAEALRDAMLAVSGLLEPDRPYASEVAKVGDVKIGRTIDKNSFKKLNVHRSVYLPILRDAVPDALALFDFADPNSTRSKRETTNVPAQSLYLMNNDYVTYLSQRMAIKLSQTHRTTKEQICNAFLEIYGRPATDGEIELSRHFVDQYRVIAEPPRAPSRSDSSSRTVRKNRNNNKSANGDGKRAGKNITSKGRRNRRKGTQDSMGDFPRRLRRQSDSYSQLPALKLTKDQQVLAVLCQSLLASAEFRIVD